MRFVGDNPAISRQKERSSWRPWRPYFAVFALLLLGLVGAGVWAAANGGKALGAPLLAMSKRAISVAGTGDADDEGAGRARPRRNCTMNAPSLNVAALARKSHDIVRARKQRAAVLYLEQEAKGDSWSYAKVAGACDLAEAERYGVRYWVDLYRKDKELMSRIKSIR